jgi:hypothetical protein
MTRRDVDLCLEVEEPRPETVLDVAKRICALPHVGSMNYRNEFVLRTAGNPRAILLCAGFHPPEGEPWKVDVLVAGPEEGAQVLEPGRELRRRLTAETREAILRIKAELSRRDGYRREYGSRHVYEAVLDHGIRTIEEWEGWFAARSREGED